MNPRIIQFVFLLFLHLSLIGQTEENWITGEISFTTSQNFYVKFSSTRGIDIGDTLFIQIPEGMQPCLIVQNKSSSSCVCKSLADCQPEKGQTILARSKVTTTEKEKEKGKEKKRATGKEPVLEPEPAEGLDDLENRPDIAAAEPDMRSEPEKGPYKEDIQARLSLASYSNFSDSYNNHHRMMGRFSMNANHIGNSRWSMEGYANYRRNYKIPKEGEQVMEQFYRVYNLALTYDVDSSMWITLGRKINRRASSIGAIDGIQAEKHFGSFFAGAIIGFRPDIFEYKINTDLFEYGVYAGFETSGKPLSGSTTLGMLEQQNAGAVDRRYLYLQHFSNIGRSVYLFGSAELDLFSRVQGVSSLNPRLTNLFVSARYRFSRKLDLTVSYDSRKQIIFYETLRTEVERLLEDDEARQGIRARINFRPARLISTGLSYSTRFQTSLQNPSDNLNGYVSHSRLPWIGGRTSLNYNWNRSAYLISRISSIRYSRTIIPKYLDTDIYFRFVDYQYRNSDVSLTQKYYGASFNYRLSGTLALGVLYEFADQSNTKNHRFNTRIIKRFR